MEIYKKHNGLYKRGKIWHWSFQYEGQSFRESTRTSNKGLAIRIFNDKKEKILKQEKLNISDKSTTFSELSQEYLEKKQNKKSIEDDKRHIELLKRFFNENIPINQITAKRIEEFILYRQNQGKNNATVNRSLACLRHMLNKAIMWDYLENNPFQKIQLLKENPKQGERLPNIKLEKLIKVTGGYLKGMIILAVNTGMRRGEIFNLKWDDINFSDREIILRETKAGEPQAVPVNDEVFEMLSNQVHISEYVFTNPKTKTKYTDLRKPWIIARKKSGIGDFQFKWLRNTFISEICEETDDISLIKGMARHSDSRITLDIYAKVRKEKKQEVAQRISEKRKIGRNY